MRFIGGLLLLAAALPAADAFLAPASSLLRSRTAGAAVAPARLMSPQLQKRSAAAVMPLRMAEALKEEVDYQTVTVNNIRNCAIIAHVDHGKTTLVDKLLDEAELDISSDDGGDRAMDSLDIERERGITIMSKVTSMSWGDVKLNIVDTPGHADFGGEVERVMSIVDGVCLLPVVVINKVDRDSSRVEEVETEVFDLMCNLGATDSQLEYATVYASGRDGWATLKWPGGEKKDMADLLDTIVKSVPAPKVLEREEFSMVVSMIEGDAFLGRICTGRISSGTCKVGDQVIALDQSGKKIDNGRISKIMSRKGTGKVDLTVGRAGDIIQLAGIGKATVAHTICAPSVTEALPAASIDPPTLAMTFCPNDSPMAGKDRATTKLTSQMIKERLANECENNIGITYKMDADRTEGYEVCGRGELQLGILIENMRREGFEIGVCPPKVLFQKGPNGEKLEPIEEVCVEVDDEYTGVVIAKLNERKGMMTNMVPASETGRTRIELDAPTRGLLGYRNIFFTDTRGSGIMTRAFKGYEPYKGDLMNVRKGVLVAMKPGVSTMYSLGKLQPRGTLFVGEGVDVYAGMILGEHSRENDLEVNAVEAKQLTNMRAAGSDEKVFLTPPRLFSLEEIIPYMQPDEMVEVTPTNIRIRKQYLDAGERKKAAQGGGGKK
ncbi:hypothetical protein T484DRAFT_1654101 [Baffinella frigidus]|nr:hypothetical protein T484DRAFT_1654101 [Cryptophyta sp. CCMP2293]